MGACVGTANTPPPIFAAPSTVTGIIEVYQQVSKGSAEELLQLAPKAKKFLKSGDEVTKSQRKKVLKLLFPTSQQRSVKSIYTPLPTPSLRTYVLRTSTHPPFHFLQIVHTATHSLYMLQCKQLTPFSALSLSLSLLLCTQRTQNTKVLIVLCVVWWCWALWRMVYCFLLDVV